MFAKLPDVLLANFLNIKYGRGGIVILAMICDKNMQFFYCSKVFWPELSEVQQKNEKGYAPEKFQFPKN